MKDTCDGLTPNQSEEYAREGVVRISGAIDLDAIEGMTSTLKRKLAARREQVARPAQLSSKTGEFNAMASPELRAILDQILGAWEEPANWGLPLVSFHTGEPTWDVPHAHWHLDLGARPGELRLARAFAVLAPSRPTGGGTGYVAGSHRLFQALATKIGRALPSAKARRHLEAQSPWLAALTSRRQDEDRVRRFMQEGCEVDGIHLRVCEMLGEPGDIILMHPLMLHAPTSNVLATPRMMLTQFVYARP